MSEIFIPIPPGLFDERSRVKNDSNDREKYLKIKINTKSFRCHGCGIIFYSYEENPIKCQRCGSESIDDDITPSFAKHLKKERYGE